MSASDRYFAKHGYYPRVVVTSGVQRITVEFCPGYVSIGTSSPFQAKVYITRSAFRELIRKVVPVTKVWIRDHLPDHDVVKAMSDSYQFEQSILREKRDQKKARTFDLEDSERRKRQHQRWLKAKERAARKQT